MKTYMDVNELALFTQKIFSESGKKKTELVKELNLSWTTINRALKEKNSRYNSTRILILRHLGYKAEGPIYKIKKI